MLVFRNVNNEAELGLRHQDDPIYVPSMKLFLTIGHFITINDPSRCDRIVGQIIGRSNNISVRIYLPLFDEGTSEYINNPSILPRRICHMSCTDATEVIKTGLVAEVSSEHITGLAFVFLKADVEDYTFHIQGMNDVYVIRFEYSQSSRCLVELNRSNFSSFPDLYPEHQIRWCECVGRTIFNTIDDVRQELWRVLCRYGQSQGKHPKETIKIRVSSIFSNYLQHKLTADGIPSATVSISKKQRRIQSTILYRSIMLSEDYQYFDLDTPVAISSFSRFIGDMSVVGLRRRMPKLNIEYDCRLNDGVNMTKRIEVFINSNMLRLRVYAFLHIIGNPIQHDWLQHQLSSRPVMQEATEEIRINSKFDYNNGTYKVISFNEEGVRAICIWGEQRGQELIFENINEVVALEVAKRH
jgi:hypothetical protein